MKTKEEIIDKYTANCEYPSYYHESDIEQMMDDYAEALAKGERKELTDKDYEELLNQHIGKMWGGLEMASIEHFIKTGTISGSFRLRLLSLMRFHQRRVEKATFSPKPAQ